MGHRLASQGISAISALCASHLRTRTFLSSSRLLLRPTQDWPGNDAPPACFRVGLLMLFYSILINRRSGQEYVMETCKDGRENLSMLNPSMLFLIICDLGFASKNCNFIEWWSRLWHLHTWASQVKSSSSLFYVLYCGPPQRSLVLPSLPPRWPGLKGNCSSCRPSSTALARGG